jgi:hypothetical protein
MTGFWLPFFLAITLFLSIPVPGLTAEKSPVPTNKEILRILTERLGDRRVQAGIVVGVIEQQPHHAPDQVMRSEPGRTNRRYLLFLHGFLSYLQSLSCHEAKRLDGRWGSRQMKAIANEKSISEST